MEEITIDRDLLHNAYYIICYFEERDKKVTNLQLQKLLYFYEAIYLYFNQNEKELFIEDFYAWDFGPVSDKVYKHFKKFSSFPIELNESERQLGKNYNKENEEYLNALFHLCGNLDTYQLVAISHSDGSPWNEINKNYKGNIPHGIILDKEKTRKWFTSLVVEGNEK